MKEKRIYWIGGAAAGLLGVALVRILSPELGGVAGLATAALGYALVIVGLTIIACATRRRRSDAFIVIEKDASD